MSEANDSKTEAMYLVYAVGAIRDSRYGIRDNSYEKKGIYI